MAIRTADMPEAQIRTADMPEAQTHEVKGIVQLTSAQLRLQRRITLVVTLLPLAAAVYAITRLWGSAVSGLDLALFLSFYSLTGLGITVGYHRLFTHRSFRAVKPVRVALAVLGGMAVEGSVVQWSATHRRHHAYADQYGDPHSPHLVQAAGLKGVLLGLWHAHSGWLFGDEMTNEQEYVPDLLADKAIVRIGKAFPWLTVATFTLPPLIAFAISGSFTAALTGFLWGSLVRIFLLHHITWSINSICHFYGKEAYRAKDESKNVWALSPISFGESWHNNHHAFQWSARLGLRAWQIDFGWYAIRALKALHLVRDVKVPTPEQLEKRKLSKKATLLRSDTA